MFGCINMYPTISYFLALFLCEVYCIPIDNAVEGEPDIQCFSDSIVVGFNTKNMFDGKLYVRGRASDSTCVNHYFGKPSKKPSIKILFTTCGLSRTRSLSPKENLCSKRPQPHFFQFLTKVDRAYALQCFYMETEKSVSQSIGVSELNTLYQTQVAGMPVCRYEILDGGPTGTPIRFAALGQQVYHKWTCEAKVVNAFCMFVHSCFVFDGSGDKVLIIDEAGCAIDKYVLSNLEYVTDLMAGREAHVFKFADKAGLFFQCQISISIKEEGVICFRPVCNVPGEKLFALDHNDTDLSSVNQLPLVRNSKGGPTTPTSTTHTETGPTTLKHASTTIKFTNVNKTTETRVSKELRYLDGTAAVGIRKRREIRSLDDGDIGTWDVRSQSINTLDIFDQPTREDEPFLNDTQCTRPVCTENDCLSASYFSICLLMSLVLGFLFCSVLLLYYLAFRCRKM